ncbi:MAG: outer membrane lipoprotein carrier protein LolA [Candidatus Eisenbacteria bacterium]
MSTGRVILIGLVLGTGVLSFIPAQGRAAGEGGGSQGESVAGETQASAPLLARLRAQFSERQAFRSPFVQTSHWAAFDEADTSSGSLIVAPPDRFRLEYLEPAGHLIGSDGRFVWTFLPEDRQVLRAHIEETTNWGGFFYEALEEAADSLALFRADAEHGTVARIALRSRPEWGVNDLYVEVSPREALPVGYGYADEEGNRFRFSFHEPQFLPAVDEDLFRFRTPEGYELFEVD